MLFLFSIRFYSSSVFRFNWFSFSFSSVLFVICSLFDDSRWWLPIEWITNWRQKKRNNKITKCTLSQSNERINDYVQCKWPSTLKCASVPLSNYTQTFTKRSSANVKEWERKSIKYICVGDYSTLFYKLCQGQVVNTVDYIERNALRHKNLHMVLKHHRIHNVCSIQISVT